MLRARLLAPVCLIGLLIATLAPSAGAATRTPALRAPVETVVPLTSGGLQRNYLLVRPDGPTANLPLLVFLHGISTTPRGELQRDAGLLTLVEEGKLLLAYPAGYHGSWDTNDNCCGFAYTRHVDDVAFVHAVIADVIATKHTKASRTYLAGYSNGGKLAMTIACTSPKGIAAFAEYGANPEPCATRVRAPYFLGSGGRDTTEPIHGKLVDRKGPHFALLSGLHAILTRDGCHGAGIVTTVSSAVLTNWTGCAKGNVDYVEWKTATHELPRPPLVPTSASVGTLMWSFLSAH